MVATLPAGHLFFADELHESFAAETALGMVSHGGAEPGEISATCARIVDGDDASWSTEWCAIADRVADRAEESRGAGHAVSAREAYLRASIYYGLANRPLFGRPVDGRLVDALRSAARRIRAGDRAARPSGRVLRGRPGRRDGPRLVLPGRECAGAAAPPHERLRRRDAGTVPVGDRGPASRLPRRGLRRPGSRPHARGAGRAAARRLGVDREPGARHAARTSRRRCRSRRAHGLEPRRLPRAARRERRPPVRGLHRRPRPLRHPRKHAGPVAAPPSARVGARRLSRHSARRAREPWSSSSIRRGSCTGR